MIFGEVKGFLWRDFNSRVRRLVAVAEAICSAGGYWVRGAARL